MNARQLLEQTRTRMLADFPLYGVQAMHLELVEKESVGTASTDGKHLFYNSGFIVSLSRPERIFLVAHAVMHVMLKHHLRRNGRDIDDWNEAGDYSINWILYNQRVGTMPTGGLLGGSYTDAAEVNYSRLHYNKQEQNEPGDGGQEQSGGDSGSGEGKKSEQQQNAKRYGSCGGVMDSAEPDPAKAEAEVQANLMEAVQIATKAGKMPGGMERVIKELVAPEADCWDLISEWVSDTCDTDRSYARISNRSTDEYLLPGDYSDDELGTLVAFIDTSGSINSAALKKFAAKLNGLRQLYEFNCYVGYCDTRVGRVDYFGRDEEIVFRPVGGGGTRFTPAFDYVDKEISEDIAGFIYFTDLCCSDFPSMAPRYPVLWAVTGGRNKVPFGDVVNIK